MTAHAIALLGVTIAALVLASIEIARLSRANRRVTAALVDAFASMPESAERSRVATALEDVGVLPRNRHRAPPASYTPGQVVDLPAGSIPPPPTPPARRVIREGHPFRKPPKKPSGWNA